MKIKALALISGGLDSLLAARLIQEQGVEVTGLHFNIPFCKINISQICGAQIKIIESDLGSLFLKLIEKPHYGFGSNMNPCIDCKILMFKKARELMDQMGAKFIITGEVLGQRPMSQNKRALKLIKRESGLDDLLLRPLSALFFPPSIAEREGWVKREKLLSLNGRGRSAQMELAKDLGIERYSTPAGGCLLTDPCFARRLKELIGHNELNLENISLLKVGRHFRIGDEARLVIGRDEAENEILSRMGKEGDYLFFPQRDLAGPTSLARGQLTDELISLASEITGAYTDSGRLKEISINYFKVSSAEKNRKVTCKLKNSFSHLLI